MPQISTYIAPVDSKRSIYKCLTCTVSPNNYLLSTKNKQR